ncbi:MAG TPA: ABC transporter permease [Caldilineaceae bacterium]|nr:ABC transporter permease [Caldilineaceae bacterium]
MKYYLLRRFFYTVILLFAVSAFSFFLIDLPPGDYLTSYVASLRDARGSEIDQAEIEGLKQQYGLDQSLLVRYGKWMRNMLNGNFGRSFAWNREVSDLIHERLWITLLTAVLTLVVTYAVAIPIGIYSATRQYSIGDYFFTIIGFMGLAMPTFFLALVLMYYINRATGFSVGGLYSPEYMNQPMNTAKFIDMLKHISILVIAVGMAGTASVIRIMRSGILDELQKPYVIAARSKGLTEIQLLLRYPVRLALNPIVSTIGWILPSIVSGATVTAIVMNIPTIGALLYEALLAQDTYVAAASIMLLSFMTVVGMFISDLLLAVVDPRIRFT